jgi:glycosyltransferase involved in cell wall biosynthesis
VCTKFTAGDIGRISTDEIKEIMNKTHSQYYELSYVFSLPIGSSPILKLDELKKMADVVQNCDLIYFANAYAFHDLMIYFLKHRYQKPVISGQHATLFSDSMFSNVYVKTIRKTLLKKFDTFHVLNSQDEQIFRKWGLRKIYRIPIGIDIKKFRPDSIEKNNAKFRVLFVGRLTLQKGTDILCQSIRMINKKEYLKEKIEFTIVGSGPLQPLVRKLTDDYKTVRYLGRVSDEALPEIYRNSDLFVMPSRRESFGITALEAQACGLPVIASSSEIILNGVNGTLIQKENAGELVSAIKAYYNLWSKNNEKFKRMGIMARKNVVKCYDWNIITDQIVNMFRDVYELRK